MNKYITIKNAHIHNLKGVDVKIPRNKLTVITGVSGSGKSSLAFDTLYEEGKRRYLLFSGTQFAVDSVSTFDSITGLSPTVAVEQRIIRQSNPRSTVGTRTKISTMLASLFATYGECEEEYRQGEPLSIEMFQRNSARGMCVKCLGVKHLKIVNEELLYGNKEMAIQDLLEGKFRKINSWARRLNDFLKTYQLDGKQPLSSLTPEQLFALKYGSPKTSFQGVNSYAPVSAENYVRGEKMTDRQKLFLFEKGYASMKPCPKCSGTGLGVQAAHTRINGKNIVELEDMYLTELYEFLSTTAEEKVREIGKSNMVFQSILTKLKCMIDVGLYHLSLSRQVPTLSGGEIQRLFLASYVIAEMDSIIFIFDEPTIGLHEVEKEKLMMIIRNLVDRGNTVVAVEHDMNFMKNADYIIDLGPGAGTQGGMKIYEGGYDEFLTCNHSITSPYLKDIEYFGITKIYRKPKSTQKITIRDASLHNLQNVTAEIPLGVLVGVAGVSGSGKSSLISDTLVPKLKDLLKSRCVTDETDPEDEEQNTEMGDSSTIEGTEHIKKCFVIDQKPIGRSRTSCPATYTDIFGRIRNLFAETEYARENGYGPGMFTVNSEGGCRQCKGDGVVHYHVGFGNFMETECTACNGTGYLPESMEVLLDGKNIREILDMTVEDATSFFAGKDQKITEMLQTLSRVGMGYIKLGQKTPTISGGESQRIKLAKELAKSQNAKGMLYILDEPTTGLSFADSRKLLDLLNELVDKGNSVIMTEHDPVMLSNCDYLIELGPGGGSDGGVIIATGTPAELRNSNESIIGGYLL